MARVTVTVEGEVEEVQDALRRLLSGELAGEVVTNSKSTSEQAIPGDEDLTTAQASEHAWSHDELARFWVQLTDPARRVLAEVAKRPAGYTFEDLAQALNTDMRRIGGNLSSVGHTMRRLYRVGDTYSKPWPIDGDKYKGVYRMDTKVAESIRNLALQAGDGSDGADA